MCKKRINFEKNVAVIYTTVVYITHTISDTTESTRVLLLSMLSDPDVAVIIEGS